MTGRYPSVTGVLHNDAGTGRQLPTLPVLLQRSKRGRIVTQSPYSKVFHLPAGDAQRIQQPWDRGWWNATNWRAVPAETLPWLGRSSPAPKRVMRGPGYGHVAPDVFHHMSFKRTMAMLGALLSQPKPFFFGAGISGTHTPLVPPLSFVKRHDESSIQLPAQHAPHGPQLARKDGFQSTTLSASQQREYIATYLAAAEYVDAQPAAAAATSADVRDGGEWVCGEQHYVRTADAALTTYLHNGRVVNTSMFNLASDPLEQRNLIQHSQAEWPYSTLRNWARLVAAEREAWPREEVQARDESASRTGEPCSEQHTRRRARMKRWRARQRRLREKRQMAVSQ